MCDNIKTRINSAPLNWEDFQRGKKNGRYHCEVRYHSGSQSTTADWASDIFSQKMGRARWAFSVSASIKFNFLESEIKGCESVLNYTQSKSRWQSPFKC